jgi:tRNA1(Val) A37 N6-methylase TrmN6
VTTDKPQKPPAAGIVRRARRPEGWQAPGPRPAGPGERADLQPGPGEDLCYLVGDWRVFQRVDGHRWSMDDLVTAHLAADAVPAPPARYLDIGCGIGSVLMSIAWRFPDARCVGIEAQDVSYGLARRSLAYNGAEGRVELRHGDLRDPALLPEAGTFDLVSGTPPFFPRGTGVESPLVQRGPCRFEHRGGVEDDTEAAARELAPRGRFALCAAYGQQERIEAAASAHDLVVVRRVDVIPRAGKAPLLVLDVLERRGARDAASAPPAPRHDALTVRDARGQWTEEFRAIRHAMGLPPRRDGA